MIKMSSGRCIHLVKIHTPHFGKARRNKIRNTKIGGMVEKTPILHDLEHHRAESCGHLSQMPICQPAHCAYNTRFSGQSLFLCCLLNVPATSWCISGMDLHRQFYVLPHWDRSCRSDFLPHPVTVYWHRADQSQRWPSNARRLAG